MHGFLRQSTASQTRTIGPFIDSGDFVTLENGLTIANTDILLKKNGGASAAKNSGGATADGSGGKYAVTFDATDSGTVGELDVTVTVAGALTFFTKFTVLEEAVYDALFAASANAFQGAAGSTKVTGVVLVDTLTTYTGNTVQTGDSYAIVNSGTHGNAALKTLVDDVPTNAELATAISSGLATYDAPTNTEMVAAFTEIKGATWATTDTLEAIRDRGDAAWITATGFATPTNITAGTITTVTNLTNAPTAGDLTATMKTSIATELATYDGPTNAEMEARTLVAAGYASPTNITAASGVALTSAYDFAKGTVAVTESYAADGAAPTPIQALMLIMQALTEGAIASTTWTIKKLDGSTTAATITLDSATVPTSKTRAT